MKSMSVITLNYLHMPQVSIIIATYNSSKTLHAALESVYTQTFQDWECIVVDGASTDKTLDIVKEYVAKDSRFRFISEPDKGIYDAFNKGWRMAQGKWVHYLGSDDRLVEDGINSLMNTPDLDKVEVVSGHCYIEKLDGSLKPNFSKGFGGCHQGKLTRRSTLEHFNGFDEQFPILADKDLMVRMEKKRVKIFNVDTFVAYFSMEGMSQNLKGLWKRTKELYHVNVHNDVAHPLLLSFNYYIGTLLSINYRRIRSKL